MEYNENTFTELSNDELMALDGGILGLIIFGPAMPGLVVLGAAALGIYNGYNDTKDQKK